MPANIIYLADDDNRLLMKEAILELDSRIDVVEALNGFELIKILSEEITLDSAVVITDMNMSVMNGLETIRALKADERLVDIPIIMVTTSNSRLLEIQAIALGATIFLEKPTFLKDFKKLAKIIISLRN